MKAYIFFIIFAVVPFWSNAQTHVHSLKNNRSDAFIRVSGTGFVLNGKPYRFMGTNFWYGMNLGAPGTKGDRPRLNRELDRLQKLGVKNLRIMAATEGPESEPWRITPVLQNTPGTYDTDMFLGLDYLLDQMAKRNMHAVVCLNNFWPWSGGMSQYLNWFTQLLIPYPPPAEGGNWNTYQKYTAQFYSNKKAMDAFNNFIRTLLSRTNLISKVKYVDDPTIMAWELANEPRGFDNTVNFNKWIVSTSDFIKSLDSRHLVTTGSEGNTPWPSGTGMNFFENHAPASIDYTTIHIWAQNWGWYDPMNPKQSFASATNQAINYLAEHEAIARRLNKPLVLEEFGISRDKNSHAPNSTVQYRDEYYRNIFSEVYKLASSKTSVVQGVNFWAWSGEGYPVEPFGGFWKPGNSFTGDPPHEAQGWYGVYESDLSTQKIISDFAAKMSALK